MKKKILIFFWFVYRDCHLMKIFLLDIMKKIHKECRPGNNI